MNSQPYLIVGVRLFAIWVWLYLIRQLPSLFASSAHVDTSYVVAAAMSAVVIGLVAFVLWVKASTIARKLLPQSNEPPPSSAWKPEVVLTTGAVLLGLYVLTEAIPNVVYYLSLVYFWDEFGGRLEMTPQMYAGMVRVAAQLGVAIWLVFGGKGLVKVFQWARYAGQQPSN
jgi:hypothetical protein